MELRTLPRGPDSVQLATITITVNGPPDPPDDEDEGDGSTTSPVATPAPTATPTPTSLPDLTWADMDPLKQHGYRRFKLAWTADDVYVRFEVQWREQHTFFWNILSGRQSELGRASVNGPARKADVRGIPYLANGWIELTVVGITSGSRRSKPLAELAIQREPRPEVHGHQHDHWVGYSLARLSGSVIQDMVDDASFAAVEAWKAAFPTTGFCKHPCGATNTDGQVIWVEAQNVRGNYYNGSFGNAACETSIACLKDKPLRANIDTHVGTRTLVIEEPPFVGRGTQREPWLAYRWTRDRSLHTLLTGLNNQFREERWRWLDRTMTHEFGHALSLPNGGSGIMGAGLAIEPAETSLLQRTYRNHIRGFGW